MHKEIPETEEVKKNSEETDPGATGKQIQAGPFEQIEEIRAALGIVDGHAILTVIDGDN